jgi:hypothetical protein
MHGHPNVKLLHFVYCNSQLTFQSTLFRYSYSDCIVRKCCARFVKALGTEQSNGLIPQVEMTTILIKKKIVNSHRAWSCNFKAILKVVTSHSLAIANGRNAMLAWRGWGGGDWAIVRCQLFVPQCLRTKQLLRNVSNVAVGRTGVLFTTPCQLHVAKGRKGRMR